MNTYIILKDCWLGKHKQTVTLNHRQAANALAGGFIQPKSAQDKKEAKK